MVIDQLVTPFAQHFSLDDVSIQYPYTKHERISLPLLILISAVCPFVIVALYVLFIDRCVSQRGSSLAHQLWELHSGCLGLLTAHGLAFTMTTTLKDLCGRPRPDLIARCLPLRGAVDGVPFGLVDKSICTQQDKSILNDGESSIDERKQEQYTLSDPISLENRLPILPFWPRQLRLRRPLLSLTLHGCEAAHSRPKRRLLAHTCRSRPRAIRRVRVPHPHHGRPPPRLRRALRRRVGYL